MDNIRESYVKLDTTRKIEKVSNYASINSDNFAIYEFAAAENDSDDVATVYNVSLKRVFSSKYKYASFYRDRLRIVLTLVSSGIPAAESDLREGELPYGSSHVCLQDNDDTDVVFSFSRTRGHIPTLLLEDREKQYNRRLQSFLVLMTLLIIVYYWT